MRRAARLRPPPPPRLAMEPRARSVSMLPSYVRSIIEGGVNERLFTAGQHSYLQFVARVAWVPAAVVAKDRVWLVATFAPHSTQNF